MAEKREKLEVLDENGGELNKVKDRSRVHKEGDWHRSVHVWIINSKGEILIQKRSKINRISPGYWTISASGHVEAGDTPLNTALKEVEEEIGVSLDEEDFEYVTTYKKSKYYKETEIQDNEFNPIFLVRKDIDLDEVEVDEKEVVEVKLIHWKDLKELISDGEIKFKPDRHEYHKLLFGWLSEALGVGVE